MARRREPTTVRVASATSSTPPSRAPPPSRKVARSARRSASHPPRPICRGSPESLECPCACCTCSNSMAPPVTRNYGFIPAWVFGYTLEINRETALVDGWMGIVSNIVYNCWINTSGIYFTNRTEIVGKIRTLISFPGGESGLKRMVRGCSIVWN